MLKKKLWTISTMLIISLLLAPVASQARTRPSPLLGVDVAASPLGQLAHWFDFLTGGAKTRTPARRTVKPKNGCGIDPQGQPLCSPLDPTPSTTPTATGGAGSGAPAAPRPA